MQAQIKDSMLFVLGQDQKKVAKIRQVGSQNNLIIPVKGFLHLAANESPIRGRGRGLTDQVQIDSEAIGLINLKTKVMIRNATLK